MTGFCSRPGSVFVLCVALLVAMTTVTSAQGTSAQAFVEGIYKPYLKKGYKGTDYSKAANVRRYFEPVLAAAIIKDQAAAAKRNEVPMLDGDPFIDAQDWEIANLKVDVKAVGATATGTVSYTNFNEARTVTLNLAKTSGGWRIAEINAPSGSLRKLFKLK